MTWREPLLLPGLSFLLFETEGKNGWDPRGRDSIRKPRGVVLALKAGCPSVHPGWAEAPPSPGVSVGMTCILLSLEELCGPGI